ncbi:MAG: outer membrane protein assembly factor BamD [Bacteroidetes bacterium]|nr:MAG: outer membrane protein assembly factor BamD [Bacteroidota bacterium]
MIRAIDQRNVYFCRLMQNSLSRLLFVFVLLIGMSSCGEYNKLLKSTDYEKMYTEAKRYYEKKNYGKAVPLLDELLIQFKADSRFKEVYLMYAYTRYGLEEFVLASYHFKNFYESFPNSDKAEEALFMHVYCDYLDSYPYYLDPSVSRHAMDNLQLFINIYPNSERVADCNKYMDELRGRLRQKSLELAKLYIRMEDYRAATVALRNTLKDYPELDNSDEVRYLLIRCAYLLAKGSVENKKEERFKEVAKVHKEFIEEHGADNKYYPRVKDVYETSLKDLKDLSVKRGYSFYDRKEYAAAGKFFLSESKRDGVEQKDKLHYLAVKSYYKEAMRNEIERGQYLNEVVNAAADFSSRFGTDNTYSKRVAALRKKAESKLKTNQ